MFRSRRITNETLPIKSSKLIFHNEDNNIIYIKIYGITYENVLDISLIDDNGNILEIIGNYNKGVYEFFQFIKDIKDIKK